MGEIRKEVREEHLNYYPEEEELLKPFLPGFYVTWARRRRAYNTDLSVYFLNPEEFMKEAYGFNQEILLVYAPYERMDARTIQATEMILNDAPAKNRVEKINYFLISDCNTVKEWLQEYISNNEESRIIIAFSSEEIKAKIGDNWFVRNALNDQFFGRDLFEYRLPLIKDTYFFGRRDILTSYIDAIKRSENRGIFGLRKTGKTSLIYKVERILQQEKIGEIILYDCKEPSIRKLRWFELLKRISSEISTRFKINLPIQDKYYNEINISDTFSNLIAKINGNRIIIVFDEIEYISFFAKLDKHWREDFIDFWQAFWACQSRNRNLTTIIAGVNPDVVEKDVIDGIQNPLFGIVPFEFLKGFESSDMRHMVRSLGKKMGLNFELEAMQYLHQRYGGHPLLTRLACSLINSNFKKSNKPRPALISKEELSKEEEYRDSELTFYCRHVVSELQEFYNDEYEMLELLACGHIRDFIELANYQEFTKHLKSYGLLSYDNNKIPKISIPVISRYIGIDLARREGRQTIYKVIEPDRRKTWVKDRVKSIMKDLRFLEKLLEMNRKNHLFGVNSFPEAELFAEINACENENENEFSHFINTCHRCFVESMENYGKSIQKPKYFWDTIKIDYPGLFDALHRVKIYRNNCDHLKLYPEVNKELINYLNNDLENKKPSQVVDLYFTLQQCTLDAFLTGIQIEINQLT